MLTIYRRHRATCKHTSRRYKGCACPLWVQGTLRGESVRRALDLTNWEAANKLVRELELNDAAKVMTLEKAAESFYADNAARQLSEQLTCPPGSRKFKVAAIPREDWFLRA